MKKRITREEAEELLAAHRLTQLSAVERKAIARTIGLADEATLSEERDAINYLRAQLLPVRNDYIEKKLSALQQQEIEIDGEPSLYEPCCCCGYRTIAHRLQLEICPVCFWEDDGDCLPERFSEENAMTLEEGMRNFKEWGCLI
ncbi:hypothetical protein MKQ70_18625 [Chitinophaga sedimenti]|uniref:CPCC family cysteine-rich protein n=1 Tax=Chitinophaga sedimenti TaxID=2033606 RepID=UPI002003D571|nr:CPCC family cysteine-rich protein [Chitinophaga sedimenti]MCK7556919.1 hypothetical protein [Chitinophaga sedimenti]